jgi:hypothetical protein
MKLKTTLLLLLLLGLLGGAVWWQKRTELSERDVDVALFGGVDVSLVNRIRIDNLERSYNLRLERDGRGIWYITDPITYPAHPGVVAALLEDVAGAKALVVPKSEWGERELGFDPPKVVLEVEETRPEGPRLHAVELGAPDLDGVRLNVRKDGRYLRTLVRLYTTLNRNPADYRSLRALTVSGDEVLEVHRSGVVRLEPDSDEQDLELHAYRDGLAWRSTLPQRALLSALDVGVLVYGATRLEVSHIVEDEVRDPSFYGFDVPEARIDLKTADGRGETLLLTRAGIEKDWYAMRADAPQVWSLDAESALRLLYPSEAMVDLRFMRVPRKDVRGLRLVSAEGRELRFLRDAQGWSVARRLADGSRSTALVADGRRIEDELARLEALELRPLAELSEAAVPGDEQLELPAAIYLDVEGETLGGRLGPAGLLVPEGDRVLFQRGGDDLLLVADAWLLELAGTPLDEFRSKQLIHLVENETRTLVLRRAERSLRFERDDHGLWHRVGESAEAKQLLSLLDSLIYLKAESFLGEEHTLADPIEVAFERFEGPDVRYVLGADPGAEAGTASVAEVGGALSRLLSADLHARVATLFE